MPLDWQGNSSRGREFHRQVTNSAANATTTTNPPCSYGLPRTFSISFHFTNCTSKYTTHFLTPLIGQCVAEKLHSPVLVMWQWWGREREKGWMLVVVLGGWWRWREWKINGCWRRHDISRPARSQMQPDETRLWLMSADESSSLEIRRPMIIFVSGI